MSVINLNDAIPAAPAGVTNVKWQADDGVAPRNVSAYMPLMIGDDDPSSPLAAPESGAVPAPEAGDAAAGKFLKADGSWEVPSGSSVGHTAVCEAPAGTLNGSNAVFTLSFTPNPASSLLLALNGVLQNPGSGSPLSGADYAVSGPTITYAVGPKASDDHTAWYTH
jgi:hypothetical protein